MPETLTLLVTPRQANILAELEAEGEIHIALVYRGTAENAQKFISAQEKYLEEMAAKNEKENENPNNPETPQNPSESEIAEVLPDEKIPGFSDENNSETEVTSDAESV